MTQEQQNIANGFTRVTELIKLVRGMIVTIPSWIPSTNPNYQTASQVTTLIGSTPKAYSTITGTPTVISSFTNDTGFQTASQVSTSITTALSNFQGGGTVTPNIRQVLTMASPIVWNFSQGNFAYINLTASRALSITNVTGVQIGVLQVQHATPATTLILPGDSTGLQWNSTGSTWLTFIYDGIGYFWFSNVGGIAGPDTTAPSLISAVNPSTAKNTIVLTYNEALATTPLSAITNYTPNPTNPVTAIAISGTTVTLTLTNPYTNTDTITLSYTGTTNPVKDLSGNNAPNFAAQPVSNVQVVNDIIFSPNTNLVNTSGRWTTSATGVSFGNTGLATTTLTGNGRIYSKRGATGIGSAVFGLKTTNTQSGYSQFPVAFFIDSANNGIVYVTQNGTISVAVSSVAVDTYVGISRTGSTIKLQTSPDAITWTDRFTYTFTSSATLYIVCDIVSTGNLDYPILQL